MDNLGLTLAGWAALNGGLLLVILLIVLIWRRTRPLTGRELAKRLAKVTDADGTKPDFTLGEIACFLRDTGNSADTRMLSAVLTDLHARGYVTCKTAPKKRLVSFGEDIQPTLFFPTEGEGLRGADAGFYAMLRAAAVVDDSLQMNEGYNWARANARELRDRLRQYEGEGRAKLRADGAVRDETHKFLFGVASQERLIYTPRGLRRATALRQWENHLREHPEDAPAQAVLFGFAEPPEPLAALCAKLEQGFATGLKSAQV